jgi:hypothetical protein
MLRIVDRGTLFITTVKNKHTSPPFLIVLTNNKMCFIYHYQCLLRQIEEIQRMQMKLSLLLAIALFSINTTYAQVNPSLCPSGAINTVDPSWRAVPSRFKIMAELVTGNEIAELTQTFSAQRDAIVFTGSGGEYRTFSKVELNTTCSLLSIS